MFCLDVIKQNRAKQNNFGNSMCPILFFIDADADGRDQTCIMMPIRIKEPGEITCRNLPAQQLVLQEPQMATQEKSCPKCLVINCTDHPLDQV